MNNITADTPRLYTALAEWFACMVYLMPRGRRLRGIPMAVAAMGELALLLAFLELTSHYSDGLPWLLCMGTAVALMYLFLLFCGTDGPLDAGYMCVQAFVLAEFTASFAWQLHGFFELEVRSLPDVILVLCVYSCVGVVMSKLLARHLLPDHRLGITWWELLSGILIGVAVFSVSNLSFISLHTPFSGQHDREIINIRTMVDLGGVAIMFAHLIQRGDLRVRRELEAVQNVLQTHYLQYQQSKESVELINRKYHDLKHQIAALRVASNAEQRNEFLDSIEADIGRYESQIKTGNAVLDTVLTSKYLSCADNGISFTCVADGTLLHFMETADLCTVIGNALDNAIEYEKTLHDPEKRLIHMSLSAQKGFVLLRVENYCQAELDFEDGLPATTKGDRDFHGYGLKSIRYVAQKYGGTLTVGLEKDWFILRFLVPIA